ncbi:peroxin [Bachmanniomyces sp. S44760]|nr:peroxin [Bachmanniomyces sp. S44760]
MISATRRWVRRNRSGLAIGIGVLGAGYVAGHYILSKISEARDRMSIDRIARENLRRRFQQNQEDCTFTVLALLPTAAENILDALPVESITYELQQKKAERLGRSTGTSEGAPSESSGPASAIDEDGKSLSSFQTESYIHTSQIAPSSSGDGEAGSQKPRKTKPQLWNELKITSITRAFTLLYTLSLLTILTRIQLNLLGRRNYLSSVVSLASYPQNENTISLENHDDDNEEQTYGNDFETNRKFLTFSWWLLHRGWRDIKEKVEAAVKDTFGPLNPREDVSFEHLSALTVEVRRKVEGSTEEERRTRKWLPYLLPPQDQEEFVLSESGVSSPQLATESPQTSSQTDDPPPAPIPSTSLPSPLRKLLDETSDLIDSPTFTHILTLLLDTTFSHLIDQKIRSQAFKIPANPIETTDPTSRIHEIIDPTESGTDMMAAPIDPNQSKTKLANILAVMTRQAHSIGNGVPNEYVQSMEEVRDLEAFAAVIYSSNFEFESVEIPPLADKKDGKVSEEEAKVTARQGDRGDGDSTGARERGIITEGGGASIVQDGSDHGFWGATSGMFESVWGRVSGSS